MNITNKLSIDLVNPFEYVKLLYTYKNLLNDFGTLTIRILWIQIQYFKDL